MVIHKIMANQMPILNMENMNPNIRRIEYAVRGPIVARANEIQNELDNGAEKPFKEVLRCNIGDCHASGQDPVTFLRQLSVLTAYPALQSSNEFPSDVKEKAQRILAGCKNGSIGSYSESCGVQVIRRDIAAYIEQRDGIAANWEDIFLSTGASGAIKSVLSLVGSPGKCGKENSGVMIPIPQYPLYSATLSEFGITQVCYYLDEDRQWGLTLSELERSIEEAADQCTPRAICVINPGNPTGQVLDREDIVNVLQFAYKHKLLVLADEVYQHNVYAPGKHFHSFKKVLASLSPEVANSVPLASFMSASKGYMGECGLRGGYCEIINFDSQVKVQLYKALSANLCPTVHGQVIMDGIVNPPKEGEPSYPLFCKERDQILSDLKAKAEMVSATFNNLPGFHCNIVQGAMYCFPNLQLPPAAIRAAEAANVKPDFFYCKELLESTGICVIPGSGFGQRPGTFHFRITILPNVEKMKAATKSIEDFHVEFLKKYS